MLLANNQHDAYELCTEAVLRDVLDRLPLGLAEEDVSSAVARALRNLDAGGVLSTDRRMLSACIEVIDDMVHDLIRDGRVVQREIGGKVRLVLTKYAGAAGDGR